MTTDPTLLAAILSGLETQREALDQHIASVRAQMGRPRRGRPSAADKRVAELQSEIAVERTLRSSHRRRPRKVSAEGRKRMAEAQQRRWAKIRRGAQD